MISSLLSLRPISVRVRKHEHEKLNLTKRTRNRRTLHSPNQQFQKNCLEIAYRTNIKNKSPSLPANRDLFAAYTEIVQRSTSKYILK